MTNEEIRKILITVTLDIAEKYGNPDALFQRILNKMCNIE